MDIGSAVGRASGISADKLANLHAWRTSPLFSDLEKLVLELADAMSVTPAHVSDELFEKLRERLNEEQLVELVASIAWENYRARFNLAFDVQAEGFSEGATCALPAREAREPGEHVMITG